MKKFRLLRVFFIATVGGFLGMLLGGLGDTMSGPKIYAWIGMVAGSLLFVIATFFDERKKKKK